VEDAKNNDPFAVTVKGGDFADGSFPYVYDKVLYMRLRAEYKTIEYGQVGFGELSALLYFCEENIGAFSAEVTDYLTQIGQPLTELYQMLPISLKTQDGDYDEDKAQEALEIISHQIEEYNSRKVEKPQSIVTPQPADKRIIDGYVELNSFNFSGRLVILAEKAGADDPYLVCEGRWDNPLGVEEYLNAVVTADYLEAVGEFIRRESGLLEYLEHERSLSGLPFQPLTAENCVPNGLDESIEGKVIIIKPEVLAPEFRSAEHQLKICNGGFGASPNARGNAVFCTDLYSGKESRYERYDVLGVADIAKLPQWAQAKLAVVNHVNERDAARSKGDRATATDEPPQNSKDKAVPSLLGRLDEGKAQVERGNSSKADKPIKKKEQEVTDLSG
jgi:hypothetical protein